jgi:hypothetical protein
MFKKRFHREPPEDFNRNQRVIIMAEDIDQETLDQLKTIPVVEVLTFSYFKGDDSEYILLRDHRDADSSSGGDEPPTGTETNGSESHRGDKSKLRDYDDFLLRVADEVRRSLPDGLKEVKTTYGHWPNDQNRRFHWGGKNVHVGVIVERRKDGDSVCVYFYAYRKEDQRIAVILKDNKDLLRKKLSLNDSELNFDDMENPINKYIGKVTAGNAAALVGPASELAAKYLQVLADARRVALVAFGRRDIRSVAQKTFTGELV